MGSTVEFETDAGMRHKIKLVFPEEADISAGRISVLTPIGTALLGLIRGQQMTFSDREGRKRQLRILAVSDWV
jgi:regulator of nucleoside diphosphate kinase